MGDENERTSIGGEDGSVAGGEVKGAGVAGADKDGGASGTRFEIEPFLGLEDKEQPRAGCYQNLYVQQGKVGAIWITEVSHTLGCQ